MKTEDIYKKIGMPDVDKEWEKFEREVIDKNPVHHEAWWRKAAVIVGIVFGVTLATLASVAVISHINTKPVELDTSVDERPLVEYVPEDGRWGDGFVVNLCPGTYVTHTKGTDHTGEAIMKDGETFSTGNMEGGSYIEDRLFRYIFLNGRQKVTMQLDGVAFDKGHLPKLTNRALKKLEITPNGDWAIIVNLVTKDDMIPSTAKSNSIHEHTIFLHSDGSLGVVENQGTKGNWINCSIITWETDQFGWSIRREIEPCLKYADYKLNIYASEETPKESFEQAEKLIREMKIPHYEYFRNLPVTHWNDGQYRVWAQKMKEKHPQYDWRLLFDELGKEHVDDDLHDKWHIIKEVYGVK